MKRFGYFFIVLSAIGCEHNNTKGQLISYIKTEDKIKFKELWQTAQDPNLKQNELLLSFQDEQEIKNTLFSLINRKYGEHKLIISRKHASAGSLTATALLTSFQLLMTFMHYDAGCSKLPNIALAAGSGYSLWHYYTKQMELENSLGNLEEIKKIMSNTSSTER